MKIKVNDEIVVEVKITQKQTCPAGTAYWNIDYMINGVCIHNAATGAIWGNPNPIKMLDDEYEWTEHHYQDISNADPIPVDRIGKKISVGTSNSRDCWWEQKSKTHRQAIIDAVAQLVD
jgi:hypothetical protein